MSAVRRSGLQREVLALYRDALRTIRTKPAVRYRQRNGTRILLNATTNIHYRCNNSNDNTNTAPA